MKTIQNSTSFQTDSGFYDESHMSRLFFKRYGFMPKSVKKNDDYFRTPKEDLDKIDS